MTTYTVYSAAGGYIVERGLSRELAGDAILSHNVQYWEARRETDEDGAETAWWRCWRVPLRLPPYRCVDLISTAATKAEAEAEMARDALKYDYWELDVLTDEAYDAALADAQEG